MWNFHTRPTAIQEYFFFPDEEDADVIINNKLANRQKQWNTLWRPVIWKGLRIHYNQTSK